MARHWDQWLVEWSKWLKKQERIRRSIFLKRRIKQLCMAAQDIGETPDWMIKNMLNDLSLRYDEPDSDE